MSDFLIPSSVIHAGRLNRAEKPIFSARPAAIPTWCLSACARFDADRPLELTNEPYAIAKIAGIELAEAYRSQNGSDFINVMPIHLYGRGDNYYPK